jgi:multicomponent Na+:H+ antiporter subunit D
VIHLPVLPVILPLIAAVLCPLLRSGKVAWAIASIVSLLCLALALVLLVTTLQEGPISYALGNWEPPWGIEYRIDALGAAVLVIVSGIAAVTLAYAHTAIALEIDADRHALFYGCFLLCLTGLLGIAATGDLFNLFVFLEISSLASYILVGFGRSRGALVAAYRYLIMGTVGATFYVIGVGLLYMLTGSLNMADLARLLPAVSDSRTLLVAFAFLAVGLGLKMALFPLHAWLPAVYSQAPAAVATFLSGAGTKIGVYILARIVFSVLGLTDLLEIHDSLIVAAGMLAMVAGSVLALLEDDVRRMMAYSSIAQIGVMVLALGFLTEGGLAAALTLLLGHALAKSLLFMALGIITLRTGNTALRNMAGLGRAMPLTMAAFSIGALSLVGFPLTAGFVGKWMTLAVALNEGWEISAGLIALSSLLTAAYLWKVINPAYFGKRDSLEPLTDGSRAMLAGMGALVLANIAFGLAGYAVIEVAVSAARYATMVQP